jgi:outer membrane receptor protein involved in Fe transport
LMQVVQSNPAFLEKPGYGYGAKDWGYCCQRAIDMSYTTVSPFVSAAYEAGPLNVDGSVRFDRQSASGTFNVASNNSTAYLPSTVKKVDYDTSKASFSFGANYRLNRDTSVFGRYSEGSGMRADRVLDSAQALDGSSPVALHSVKQLELGTKVRSGDLSAAATLFFAKTAEAATFEATTRITSARTYESKGLELEAAYLVGNFRLAGGMTITDAEITANPDNKSEIGKTPRRQAKVVYQLVPSYTAGPATLGASIIGTSKAYAQNDNAVTMPAYTVVNAFVNYQVMKNVTLGLSVNNLFNAIGYTESEGTVARSIAGRTVKASLRYAF